MRDDTEIVYPCKFEQKANFVYTKLTKMPLLEYPNVRSFVSSIGNHIKERC